MFARETNTIAESEKYKTQLWNPNYLYYRHDQYCI